VWRLVAHRLLLADDMDSAADTNVLLRSRVEDPDIDERDQVPTDLLERSAAYVAARSVLDVIRTATTTWPTDIAQAARQRAGAMVNAIARSLEYPPTSAARRRCVRNAIGNAIELSAITDVARAQGFALAGSMESAGRTMSLLGFAFHATLVPDD
jgi:hypothetical protein